MMLKIEEVLKILPFIKIKKVEKKRKKALLFFIGLL